MRSRSNSGGTTGSGLLAHSITIGSSTSMPTPFEDATQAIGGGPDLVLPSRQHWSQGGAGMGGLRDLLPSMQEELAAGLSGAGGSDGGALLQAPSFLEASKSFEAARGSTWQQQQPGAAADSGSDAAGDQSHEGSGEQQELVRLLFARYNPASTNYTGLDVEVTLRLSTLVFYCNRPTVAALMVFGTDLGAVNTLLAGPAADAQVCGCLGFSSPGLLSRTCLFATGDGHVTCSMVFIRSLRGTWDSCILPYMQHVKRRPCGWTV